MIFWNISSIKHLLGQSFKIIKIKNFAQQKRAPKIWSSKFITPLGVISHIYTKCLFFN